MSTDFILNTILNFVKNTDPEFRESMTRRRDSIDVNGNSIEVFLNTENPNFFGIAFNTDVVVYDTSVTEEPGVIQYFSVLTPHDALDVILELLKQ
jgi:hypothetical protein